MTEELLPCKICGKLPDKYETRSHYIIDCQSDDEHGPEDYHRLFIARSSKNEAIKAWNLSNSNKSEELPDWLKKAIETRIHSLSRIGETFSDEPTLRIYVREIEQLEWVLSLKKPEEES